MNMHVSPWRSFQIKKQGISVGLAERIVVLFGRDPKNVSNSVQRAHFCLEYDDWREAFLCGISPHFVRSGDISFFIYLYTRTRSL